MNMGEQKIHRHKGRREEGGREGRRKNEGREEGIEEARG